MLKSSIAICDFGQELFASAVVHRQFVIPRLPNMAIFTKIQYTFFLYVSKMYCFSTRSFRNRLNVWTHHVYISTLVGTIPSILDVHCPSHSINLGISNKNGCMARLAHGCYLFAALESRFHINDLEFQINFEDQIFWHIHLKNDLIWEKYRAFLPCRPFFIWNEWHFRLIISTDDPLTQIGWYNLLDCFRFSYNANTDNSKSGKYSIIPVLSPERCMSMVLK